MGNVPTGIVYGWGGGGGLSQFIIITRIGQSTNFYYPHAVHNNFCKPWNSTDFHHCTLFHVICRILKEFQTIQASKPHGIEVSVPSDNIYIWEAKFPAPEQSLYKGANLKIQIVLPYLLH